jgi:beta-ribofuranosylaminobenzene 5'-phosphate synthase
MIRVRTGSRLHFGLFSLLAESAAASRSSDGEVTIPHRKFGGVGLMVDDPGIELTVEAASDWAASGPLAARALEFAHRYCNAVGMSGCFRLNVVSAAPEHVGLGTGTQLGLSVARALAELTQQPYLDTWSTPLAQHIGRGTRSAVGIHGFQCGGFIVEAGAGPSERVAPVAAVACYPPDCRILLVIPRGLEGLHGARELNAFTNLARLKWDDRTTETLCRIVLLGMLPALQKFDGPDINAFGEAVYDFNRRVGEMFRPVQGGIYAHPHIEHVVKSIRAFGVKGVGQSSWGPTIFALGTADDVTRLRDWLSSTQGLANEEMMIVSSTWRGVEVTRDESFD